MKIVYLATSEGTIGTRHEVSDLTLFLLQTYGHKIPAGLRIYHQGVGLANDVTPKGNNPVEVARQVRRLRTLPGPFYVVHHPGDLGTLGWVLVAVIVASVAAAVLLRPKLPNVASRNQTNQSPNNSLSERTNEPRVNGRVPCIVGTVRSTPDMLAPPYNIYVDHVKREVSYMCIGEGRYQIHDLRDDTTDIAEIPGATAEVYGPYTSPNGGSPQHRVGTPINIPLLIPKRIDSVNGQTLLANDAGSIVRKGTQFVWPNEIRSQEGGIDYTATFVPGDSIVVTGAAQSDGTFSYSAPADEGWFVSHNGNPPQWGEVYLPGDKTADWAPGQLVTLSNATVIYQVPGGETSPNPTDPRTAILNGLYSITQVAYEQVLPPDVDDTTMVWRTRIRFDISTNSSAWRWPQWVANSTIRYAMGSPTLTRPSTNVLFDLSGTYTVVTVSASVIVLDNPAAVNPDWTVLANDYGGVSNTLYPVLATSGDRWVGWFTVRFPRPINRFIANVLAPGGMFAVDTDGEQRRTNVSFRIEAQRVDDNGNPFGAVHAFERTIIGSATTRAERAMTVNEPLVNTPNNNWRFRARRLTGTNHSFEGEIIDEIIWNDLYVASNVDKTEFGDVTTVYTLTSATQGATAVKQRRFNTLVTRMLPQRISGDQFTTELYPTNKACDILSFLALDPRNGRRTKAQVDFDSIYDAYDQVVAYFGTPLAGEFCYTFDSDTLSFEEIATQVAQAMFCQAYRRGSKLKVYFERQTDQRAMLFNHRNVLPNTEENSGSFGYANAKSHDGVEYEWTDPDTDTVATLTLPPDGSALNPLKIESAGIRNSTQAHFHGWREYMKLVHQRRSKTFDALYMANLLIPKNVVLCADGCRPETISGEVLEANGLVLTLDNPIDWNNGTDFYIFLQTTDVSVDSIPISPGPSEYHVVLARAPVTPVVVDGSSAFSTSYTVVSTANQGTLRPYLVVEKSDKQNMVVGMQVVEYTDQLYSHDKDFINGLI